jgi:spermidine synthase
LTANVIFFPRKGELYKTLHLPAKSSAIYLEEGIDGIVVTYQQGGDNVSNYINGLGHGYRPGYGFYYETIEAMSFAPKVENVLIIGYGLGAITEMILKANDLRNITLVELNGTLIKNLKKIPLFEEMLADRRIDLIIDDGRRFLLRSQQKFDLILLDPLRTTTSYSNNLYSHQFFELANQHLNQGGVLMVWMDEHKVMPKTILSVFDQIRMYNVFCLASNAPLRINNERREDLLNSFSLQERKHILKNYKYLGSRAYIEAVTDKYPINQDWKPVCEYYLGLIVKERFFLRK